MSDWASALVSAELFRSASFTKGVATQSKRRAQAGAECEAKEDGAVSLGVCVGRLLFRSLALNVWLGTQNVVLFVHFSFVATLLLNFRRLFSVLQSRESIIVWMICQRLPSMLLCDSDYHSPHRSHHSSANAHSCMMLFVRPTKYK